MVTRGEEEPQNLLFLFLAAVFLKCWGGGIYVIPAIFVSQKGTNIRTSHNSAYTWNSVLFPSLMTAAERFLYSHVRSSLKHIHSYLYVYTAIPQGDGRRSSDPALTYLPRWIF